MSFQANKLPSGRWGIYAGERLIATIGDRHALNLILAQLPNTEVLATESAEPVGA